MVAIMNMPVETKRFLDEVSKFPPLHNLTPEEMRKVVVANAISESFQLASVENIELQGPHGPIPIRIYRPTTAKELPILLFYHGGGFVFNRMENYDPMCSKLAIETGHAVVSVD